MSLKELREKGTDTLGLELKDKQKHLFDLRSQAVTEKLEDPSQLKKTRREIARLKTIVREREIVDQKKAKVAAADDAAKDAAKKAATEAATESTTQSASDTAAKVVSATEPPAK
jgi:large subunit ribosomal protein L29